MKKIKCSSCGIELAKGGVIFKCPSCGKQLIARCDHCRKVGI